LSTGDVPSVTGVLWAGTFAHQLGERSDLEAHARGVFRLSEDRKPYVASADATYRRFFYGSEEDPLGVLGVGAFADLSDNVGAVGTENGASWDLGARAAFTHFFSRASSVA